jgi:FixJ family two-component response regulator
MSKGPVIAVVDDDASIRRSMSSLMRSRGYIVYTFAGAEDFLHSLYFGVTECLITDVQMPKMNGIQLLFRVHKKDPRIPVILMSGAFRQHDVEGACDLLVKPFDDSSLLASIANALNRRRRGLVWPGPSSR